MADYHWVVIRTGVMPAPGDKPEPFQMDGMFYKLGAPLTDQEAAHLQTMPNSTKVRRIPVGAHPSRLADGTHVLPDGSKVAPKPKPVDAPVEAPPTQPVVETPPVAPAAPAPPAPAAPVVPAAPTKPLPGAASATVPPPVPSSNPVPPAT